MKRIFSLSGILLWGCGVAAQTQPTDTVTDRVHQLQEVTVTETRQEHSLKSTAPMHILDRSDMLRMGVTNMADALHRLPGITLRDYGGAGGMKTVSVRGFGAKHTGVSYDGVMLSDCQSGEIDLSRYSLDNVDHLSLIIGDNNDIFIPARQAATPAVLNIGTLRLPNGNTRPHLTTQVKAGSFGYVSPFVRYEQNFSDRFAFAAVGEYTYAENDYPYTIDNVTETVSDRRRNSRMNAGHGELEFLCKTGDNSRLSGKVYYYDNDRQLPGIVYYYSNTSRESLRERNFFGQMQFQTHWGEQWSLKAHAKYNWAASFYDDGMTASQIADGNYYQREYYGSAALLFTPAERWAFDYSADYAFNNLNSNLPMDGHPHRHTVLQSLTTKYQTERLTVTGRLLYALFFNGNDGGESSDNMRRLSPSLSLSYALLPDLRVRASYKQLFRAPTFNENYYFHYGSPSLQPERTSQFNLGLTWATDSRRPLSVQATLDGYYNEVTDMIVAIPYNMFVWTCSNLAEVRIVGLDATLRGSWRLAGGHTLSMAGSYTMQKVENRSSADSPYYKFQIAYTPVHSGSLSLSWENPWVNLSVSGVAVGERWSSNAHLPDSHIPSYFDLGLTAYRQFRILGGLFEARADLKNLTDKNYQIVRHYPMPGRSFQISLNYKF